MFAHHMSRIPAMQWNTWRDVECLSVLVRLGWI